MTDSFFNWSGGKDSALALYQCLKNPDINIRYLLTTINQKFSRISMHGVREILLNKQAESIGIPLLKIPLPEYPSMDQYERELSKSLRYLKRNGISNAIFGDIFLEDLKEYRQKQLRSMDITTEFPLWKKNTSVLIREFINSGFKSVTVCVDEKYLDKTFAGRIIDHDFLADLPDNVDPCGENGEYHTFVFDGPIFNYPVDFKIGDIIYRKYKSENDHELNTGFWFCDLIG